MRETALKEQRQRNLVHNPLPSVFEDFAPLVKIRTAGTVAPFILYPFQEQLIQTIEQNKNTIILKSRQMGISETLCAYILFRALREPGFTAIVVSKTQQDSSDLAVRIRNMHYTLGGRAPALLTDSKMELSFDNRSMIKFLPGTARAARGIPSCSLLWFDEAAFIEGIEAIYQSAIPTLSMVGDKAKVIFNSTPNGKLGLFYEIWKNTQLDELTSTFTPSTLHYSLHPVYSEDPEWATKTKTDRQLTDSQWGQEYELDFSESSANVFNDELIHRAAVGAYQQPQNGHVYVAGVDPNFGSTDRFVTTIFDITQKPFQLVAVYKERKRTVESSIEHSVRMFKHYKPALVTVETNSGGNIVLERMQKLLPGLKLESEITSRPSKIANVNRLVLLFEQNSIQFPPDKDLIEEFLNFRRLETGAIEAAPGYSDDCVMSFAMAFAHAPAASGFRQGTALWSH